MTGQPETSIHEVPAASEHPCGVPDQRRCTAVAKSTGARCRRRAIAGGTVCTKHGGGAPNVREAARRNVERAAAVRAVAAYGLPVDVDPHAALLAELHRTAGHVAWLGDLVAQLDDLMVPTMFGLKPSAWVELYQSERTHLVKVARDCVSAGVEERQVRIAEEQAHQFVDVIRGVVSALGHDPWSVEVRTIVRRELEAVRNGDPEDD